VPLRPNGSRKPIAVLKVRPGVGEHGIATAQFAVVKHDNAGSFCLRGSEPSRIAAISKHVPPKGLCGRSIAVVAAIGCIMVYWFVLPSTLMQRALTLRRSRPLANLNLSVVHMRQHLLEVAHVEPFSAARALHEMIGLGFGDAVSIDAGIAWDHLTLCGFGPISISAMSEGSL
jgi:hypothetical protein